MKIWLDKYQKGQLLALQVYAEKNNKLLCLRDRKSRLLAVGLSIKALQLSKSKKGFLHYQVIKKLEPIYLSKKELFETYNPVKIKRIINNNFQIERNIYTVSVQIYEGKKVVANPSFMKNENYWFTCYQYYLKYPYKYSKFDLINKKIASKTRF